MPIDRREFLAGTAGAVTFSATALSGAQDVQPRLGAQRRIDFPVTRSQTYLNSSARHPLGRHVLGAMEQHLRYQAFGTGLPSGLADQVRLKIFYGVLLNASQNEVPAARARRCGQTTTSSQYRGDHSAPKHPGVGVSVQRRRRHRPARRRAELMRS